MTTELTAEQIINCPVDLAAINAQQTITGSCVLITVDKAEYDGLKRLETLHKAMTTTRAMFKSTVDGSAEYPSRYMDAVMAINALEAWTHD